MAFADKVYSHLSERGFYFTNLVKWTGENGDLPDSNKVKSFLPILLREIQIVNPKFIVTFGLIPFSALIGEQIRFKDYYEQSVRDNKLLTYPLHLGATEFSVIPCYFPVGRGIQRERLCY